MSMWYRIVTAAVSILLASCTVMQVDSGTTVASMTDAEWQSCVPVDPELAAPSGTPCFRAVLTAENEVTLQWRVTNSVPRVYIYNDFGNAQDIGFQPATCQTEPQHTCSTTLKFKTSGFHRWLLGVENPGGARTHVATAITVPGIYPVKAVYGGGVVDMLSPTDQTVTWIADSHNATCAKSTITAWIERPGSSETRFPRCGRGARFTIPAAEFSEPGYRDYGIRDCHRIVGSKSKFCSYAVSVSFKIGSDHFLGPSPIYAQSGRDLEIAFTTNSGDIRRLSSATLIPQNDDQDFIATTESSYTVNAELLTRGVHTIKLIACRSDTGQCSPGDDLLVVVDSPVDWELGRDYVEDFRAAVGYGGNALELTYDASGGIWSIAEFSNAIEHIPTSGVGSSLTVPLGRYASPDRNYLQKVAPFAFYLDAETTEPTSVTTLGERATRVGSQVWFTQGGGMLGSTNIGNHSRIISFDPLLSDSPTTPFDDRLCVYNVPTDDPNRLGNNQVIGLTATTNRIWIGESRGLNDEPSAISSFVPDPASCDNLLNFDDPEALARQRLQYCAPGQTPEQDACMQKYLLDKLPPGIKVAHVAADPLDGSIWFADAHGRYLGNLDPGRDPLFKLFPLPDNPANSNPLFSSFRGFPWTVRVQDDAVYIVENVTRDLLRFDKATATFDKIYVPGTTGEETLNGMDIDPKTHRLWFSVGMACVCPMEGTSSTIGYIDLTSWREYLANPVPGKRISAVMYRGLETITAPYTSPEDRANFSGIAIDPNNGKIAVATGGARGQITELTPKADFRP